MSEYWLPNEILIQIIQTVDPSLEKEQREKFSSSGSYIFNPKLDRPSYDATEDFKLLRVLRLVNKMFNEVATPLLFRSICFNDYAENVVSRMKGIVSLPFEVRRNILSLEFRSLCMVPKECDDFVRKNKNNRQAYEYSPSIYDDLREIIDDEDYMPGYHGFEIESNVRDLFRDRETASKFSRAMQEGYGKLQNLCEIKIFLEQQTGLQSLEASLSFCEHLCTGILANALDNVRSDSLTTLSINTVALGLIARVCQHNNPSIIKKIKTLNITTNDPSFKCPVGHYGFEDEQMRDFKDKVLDVSESLQSLSLRYRSTESDFGFQNICFNDFYFVRRLKELTFDCCHFDFSALNSFISNHAGNLESLTLARVQLKANRDAGERWAVIFESLCALSKLTRVRLVCSYNTDVDSRRRDSYDELWLMPLTSTNLQDMIAFDKLRDVVINRRRDRNMPEDPYLSKFCQYY